MIAVPGEEGAFFELASLEQTEVERERLYTSLSPDELLRGDRLLDPVKRERFLVGRGILRGLLGGVTGEKAREISFCYGEYGKPSLQQASTTGSIGFNASHSGTQLLVGVVFGGEVGVDLEELRLDLDFAPMARRYFSPREQQELFSLPWEEQLPAFYRCWTRKEAYLKGIGAGFSQPSTCFDVSLLPGEKPALLAHRITPDDVDRWRLHDLPVPSGYCAAIAIRNT
ncbi:4'-phosphopantetheinyl transferase [Citrifermentans bremense]|uniref:4'-phosphopantetheinyl transferase n=1 Tax=Citrifermentans bremense TaxID=60035 RepID=A0A6S6M0Q7_9BACT|nr:4'-phosphopantetheinyl transferase superfamily protein [Citrifermentans bremense]BCG47178.1 4'-phosphopantetheinyl transferase [Citrifermentans bremense]